MDIDEHIIYFELKKGWELRGSHPGRANAGTVELIEGNDGRMIVLTFDINFMYDIMFLIILIGAVFFFDWIMVVLVLVLPLVTWLNVVSTKTKHKELLEQIITDYR